MIFVVMVLFVSSLLVAGAFAAANGDIHLNRTNTAQDKAYFAAQAGLQAYLYQLNTAPNYWTTCPHTPEKEKVKEGVKVPGTTEETYTYETLPATGHATCESGKQGTIVESAGSASGTFRIKATGKSGGKSRSIVRPTSHTPAFSTTCFSATTKSKTPSRTNPNRQNVNITTKRGWKRPDRSMPGHLLACPRQGQGAPSTPTTVPPSVEVVVKTPRLGAPAPTLSR